MAFATSGVTDPPFLATWLMDYLVEINIYKQVRRRFSPFGHPSAANAN